LKTDFIASLSLYSRAAAVSFFSNASAAEFGSVLRG
jgi:hypothetical protein